MKVRYYHMKKSLSLLLVLLLLLPTALLPGYAESADAAPAAEPAAQVLQDNLVVLSMRR